MRVSALMHVKGFSLVEIMGTIVVMGILTAIAIPAYGDHVIKSKVADMIASSEDLQKAIAEYRVVNGNLSEINPKDSASTFKAVGADDPTEMCDSISSVKFAKMDDQHMAIAICGSTAAQGTNEIDTVDVYITGTFVAGNMKWGCGYSGNSKFVPKSCRTLYEPTIYGALVNACVH